jgi:hypothetical protein
MGRLATWRTLHEIQFLDGLGTGAHLPPGAVSSASRRDKLRVYIRTGMDRRWGTLGKDKGVILSHARRLLRESTP